MLPSLTLYARIIHIGRRPAGWTVGYNRTHTCRKDSLLATLPIGYGDGYRRALSGRSCVVARGMQVPVVGTISMNCIVADITPLEHSAAGLPQVGEPVALIGGPAENRITVEEIAEKSGTIPYVVTTQLGTNVQRRYSGERQPAAARELEFDVRPLDAAPVKAPLRMERKAGNDARIASA